MDDVVDGPFKGSSSMKQAVKDGFEEFINMRHNRPAEMLAKFFDMKLRTGYIFYRSCAPHRTFCIHSVRSIQVQRLFGRRA